MGTWGGVPSLGTLENAFERSPGVGISHYGCPVTEREPGMGGAGMPVTLMDEGRTALVVEYLSVRDSTKGT
jgi:hypothetical protein